MRTRLTLLAVAACLFYGLALCGQTSGSDGTTSRTDTTDSQSSNINPGRTVETHTQNGNRTVDSQSLQRRGVDGNFEPYQDVEKETVKVNATTVRTTTRTYGRDSDGAKTLVQVTEEEKRMLPGGDSSLVRSTSNPDADGRLQMVQREIEATKKISKDVEETKTTVMLPSSDGRLAPAVQVLERRQQGADNTIDSQKTTLLPDGNGNWQVGEVKHATIREDSSRGGKTRSSDESISRPDLDGNLDEVSRTVTTESESAPGETRKTVETDSVDVPGTARDGSLHPVERKTTIQHTSSTGRQTTEQVQQPNPADPGSGLRVTTVTIDTSSPGAFGTHGTRTIQTRGSNDGDGLGVVSVGTTTESGSGRAVQVQIAPPAKEK
jgi:hypothetical protein